MPGDRAPPPAGRPERRTPPWTAAASSPYSRPPAAPAASGTVTVTYSLTVTYSMRTRGRLYRYTRVCMCTCGTYVSRAGHVCGAPRFLKSGAPGFEIHVRKPRSTSGSGALGSLKSPDANPASQRVPLECRVFTHLECRVFPDHLITLGSAGTFARFLPLHILLRRFPPSLTHSR